MADSVWTEALHVRPLDIEHPAVAPVSRPLSHVMIARVVDHAMLSVIAGDRTMDVADSLTSPTDVDPLMIGVMREEEETVWRKFE